MAVAPPSGTQVTNPSSLQLTPYQTLTGSVTPAVPTSVVPLAATSYTLTYAATTCPAFSVTDPGPFLGCFFSTEVKFIFVNLAAAAIIAAGIRLAFAPEIDAAIARGKEAAREGAQKAAEAAAAA